MKLFAVTYEHPRLSMETLHSILAAESVAKLTAWVSAAPEIVESAVVATCLRVEIYGIASHPELARDALDSILGERHGRLLLQQDAVAHLCRVTAGLESIVWGETMVTAQVRRAYRSSVDRSLCGPNLHRLFHAALRTARSLRASGTVRSAWPSLGALAVRRAAADLTTGDRVVVCGAGALGQVIARDLVARGFSVAVHGSRVAIGAVPGADSLPLPALATALSHAKAVFTCSNRGAILRAADFSGATPLVIDLGVPPNFPAEEAARAGVTRLSFAELAEWAGGATQGPTDGAWDAVIGRTVREFGDEAASGGEERKASHTAPAGAVFLVGAGPGDPELLTVRAARLLESADIVFFDALVPPALLNLIPRGVRRVPIGRRAGRVVCPAELAHRGMIAWARRGAQVVRLKSGDPAFFGSTAEEIAALHAAGVAWEIVPGITSASAAAAQLGVPLTERGVAASCTFVTFKSPSSVARAAREADSVAVYMGAADLPEVARLLIESGRPPADPVVVVVRASQPDSRVSWWTLGELAKLEVTPVDETPAMVLVGAVLRTAVERVGGVTEKISARGEKSVAIETPGSIELSDGN